MLIGNSFMRHQAHAIVQALGKRYAELIIYTRAACLPIEELNDNQGIKLIRDCGKTRGVTEQLIDMFKPDWLFISQRYFTRVIYFTKVIISHNVKMNPRLLLEFFTLIY